MVNVKTVVAKRSTTQRTLSLQELANVSAYQVAVAGDVGFDHAL